MPHKPGPETLVRQGIRKIQRFVQDATVDASRHDQACECEYWDGLFTAYGKSLAVLEGILASLTR